ncbi:tRNA (adenosine(37)-N6)-dimethylallyltransferase MiaA [Heliophilum fasciatum]|uniref:tRNA dimethylallyltransferase n=1 Tax=Heliophilum fasciatum TaxID=35700 RepID=A0A4R2RBX0_9FIRM|nr:tRNA (adenosine(37)-N6)-dimethylallyltransferase MiaA [Heliophilum fasciatum]MCW2279453.1 tRNA dimethylallyltransferase [Heliophilum fasciatum]TCP59874.1 tRNA dimethylallyltransferase [Heliophilum fasciatum]
MTTITIPEEKLNPLIVIVGPTAVGKSDTAIAVAQKVGGEIISGDSMQVYRGMDIGTAKLPWEERGGIPHHLIDIINPDEPYSVAEFQKQVTTLIPEIVARGKLPILVGGTGLYVRSVIDHYEFAEDAKDPNLRQELETKADQLGLAVLHDELAVIDPVAAQRIHLNDRKRIIRAIEVYRLTGKRQSEFAYADQIEQPKYHLAAFALTMERATLYRRIDQRARYMVESGLVDEVQALLARGYSPALTSMQGLGYRQMIGYLQGSYDLEQALTLLQRDTRHFAKRQLTWFRRDHRLRWLAVDVLSPEERVETICTAIDELVAMRKRDERKTDGGDDDE